LIRKLGNSVELSTKESQAQESEKKYREKVRKLAGSADGSPVQSLRGPIIHKKDPHRTLNYLKLEFIKKLTKCSSTAKEKRELCAGDIATNKVFL